MSEGERREGQRGEGKEERGREGEGKKGREGRGPPVFFTHRTLAVTYPSAADQISLTRRRADRNLADGALNFSGGGRILRQSVSVNVHKGPQKVNNFECEQ